MIADYSDDYNNLLLDFEALPIEAIELEAQQIEQAVELSSQTVNEEKQWRTYLNALALFGFESWLRSRRPELTINSDNCSIFQPSYTSLIDGVINLEVGEFKLYLLATGTMEDDIVTIPRAVVDLPECAAHFYVIINVREEQEEATVEGFIRYDALKKQQHSSNLQAESDWTYELPLTWFEQEPDDLLLYLSCLGPDAINLPAASINRLTALNNIQTELESLIPQLQSSETPLWQILSWEKAIPLLTNPDLLDWLYQLQAETGENNQHLNSLTQTIQKLTQRAINLGVWLNQELDEFSQTLAWTLFPVHTFAIASMRSFIVIDRESPTEEFEAIIAQLRNSEMDIPTEARGAYQDLKINENAIRLYAATWEIEEQDNLPEWTLLIVIGAQPNYDLPQGLKLQIKEQDTILDEKIVEQSTNDTYLYSRVIGTENEQFAITILLANGDSLNLPLLTSKTFFTD